MWATPRGPSRRKRPTFRSGWKQLRAGVYVTRAQASWGLGAAGPDPWRPSAFPFQSKPSATAVRVSESSRSAARSLSIALVLLAAGGCAAGRGADDAGGRSASRTALTVETRGAKLFHASARE